MDLRVSRLGGLDLAIVGLWPTEASAAGPDQLELPWEVRCIGRDTEQLVEYLARAHATGDIELTRLGMHTLVTRAEQHRRDHR